MIQSLPSPPKLMLIYFTASKGLEEGRTFSICSSVVLPALSKPRKRSLACLLRSPREARTSQTIGATIRSAPVSAGRKGEAWEAGHAVAVEKARWQLTPVNNEHDERSKKRVGVDRG